MTITIVGTRKGLDDKQRKDFVEVIRKLFMLLKNNESITVKSGGYIGAEDELNRAVDTIRRRHFKDKDIVIETYPAVASAGNTCTDAIAELINVVDAVHDLDLTIDRNKKLIYSTDILLAFPAIGPRQGNTWDMINLAKKENVKVVMFQKLI